MSDTQRAALASRVSALGGYGGGRGGGDEEGSDGSWSDYDAEGELDFASAKGGEDRRRRREEEDDARERENMVESLRRRVTDAGVDVDDGGGSDGGESDELDDLFGDDEDDGEGVGGAIPVGGGAEAGELGNVYGESDDDDEAEQERKLMESLREMDLLHDDGGPGKATPRETFEIDDDEVRRIYESRLRAQGGSAGGGPEAFNATASRPPVSPKQRQASPGGGKRIPSKTLPSPASSSSAGAELSPTRPSRRRPRGTSSPTSTAPKAYSASSTSFSSDVKPGQRIRLIRKATRTRHSAVAREKKFQFCQPRGK